MTDQSARTRQYHQSMREKGLAPLRVWLGVEDIEKLKALSNETNMNISQLLVKLIHTSDTIGKLQARASLPPIPVSELL